MWPQSHLDLNLLIEKIKLELSNIWVLIVIVNSFLNLCVLKDFILKDLIKKIPLEENCIKPTKIKVVMIKDKTKINMVKVEINMEEINRDKVEINMEEINMDKVEINMVEINMDKGEINMEEINMDKVEINTEEEINRGMILKMMKKMKKIKIFTNQDTLMKYLEKHNQY